MGASLGINVAPDANPAAIAATGAKLVRIVYRDNIPFRPWLNDLKQRGVDCWFVGDSSPESLGDNEGQWAGRMTVARSNYGDLVKRWTWGNEPDGTGMASWTMSWQMVNRLLMVARATFPRDQGYILSTPGLVSGDTNWPARLRFDLVDFLDCHLYAQFIDNAAARANLNGILDRYKGYGLPTVIGEYDSRTPGLSAYFRDYPGVAAAAVFCWDDGMTTAEGIRLGLRQNPAAYDDFVKAAKELVVSPLPAPRFVLGFEKWHNLEPALLGTALANERTVAPEWQIQPTDRGVLSWVAGKGHAFVQHDGRVFRWSEDQPASWEVPG